MKNGKTAGQSGILPEMVKVLSYDDSFLEVSASSVERRKRSQELGRCCSPPHPKERGFEELQQVERNSTIGKIVA